MTEKELRKLNRYQLLELLLVQTERAEKLQNRLETVEKTLFDQHVELSALGSIAEASLKLRGVFEAAQAAADLYLEAAKEKAEEIEREAREKAEAILAEARASANNEE